MTLKIKSERGAVAIFLVTLISILLVVTTTYAARLTVSELSQAGQVGQSEQAYYAAEAGVEDAFLNIDQNPSFTTTGTCSDGDYAILNGSAAPHDLLGNVSPGSECPTPTVTGIAWRNRKVYVTGNSTSPIVSYDKQYKDQTISVDASNLQCYTSCAPNPNPYDDWYGLRYCWTAASGSPYIEFTAISWDSTDVASNLRTEKYEVSSGALKGSDPNDTIALDTGSIQWGPNYVTPPDSGSLCFRFKLNKSVYTNTMRYLFRIKPVFGGNTGTTNPQNNGDAYFVSSQTMLLGNSYPDPGANPPAANWLYSPGGTVTVDATGQSGSVRRRVITSRNAAGQVLDLVDYVLYSGGSGNNLCKAGVQSSDTTYDTNNCTLSP